MNLNRFFAGVLACCVVGGALPSVGINADNAVITASAADYVDYTEGTYEQLTYKDYGFYIEISGCDESAESVEIPAEIDGVPVTSIGEYAFAINNLTEITIPNSVTSIGDRAFWDCTGLTAITIPDSVTSIGDCAFGSCTGLKEITIPDSVTSIGYYSFGSCTGLTAITFLNPDCEINGYDSLVYYGTISNGYDYDTDYYFNGTIYGYDNSTAHKYAKMYEVDFVSLGKAPEKPSSKTLFGDANEDGKVTMADATAILQHISNQDKYVLNEQAMINADVVGNGNGITGEDALAIQMVDAGLLKQKQLPIAELPKI